MTKTPPSHEGPAGPAVVPALSSHGVDRVRRRRRRALWGAVGVVVVLALLLGLGGWLWWLRSGMAGASQPTASAPPPLTSTSLPSGVEKGDLVSLGGSIRPKRTDKGTLESAGMHVEQNQWVGSVRWRPKGGGQSSMRCIWVRASILTAWAPSHSLPSLLRPHPRPIRARPAEQEKEFTSTSTSTPESNGAGRQTRAEPMKVSRPHELI